MTKRTKTHKFDVDIRYSSLPEAIQTLQRAQTKADNMNLEHVSLEIEADTDEFGSTCLTCRVSGEAPETDKEYEERLKYEKQQKDNRRKAYENLKKEFEKE